MSAAVEVNVLPNHTIGKVVSYSDVAIGMFAYLVR